MTYTGGYHPPTEFKQGMIPWNKSVTKEQLAARFWPKVEKTNSCWNWKGYKAKNGYGLFKINLQPRLAHRIAYQLLVGDIPHGKQIDHLCRNRLCVNPAHMEPVTLKTNVLRGVGLSAQNAKKTHCKNGHELSGINLHITKAGTRECRICQSANRTAWRKIHRERYNELQRQWRSKQGEAYLVYMRQYRAAKQDTSQSRKLVT